ncbi:tetratricopeptide repeat protein [Jejuia spongiicola]|uniref:Tetratricopeptide repeat protein n=1 Tax=Jejuia spongiicola TaxID=2942207 RepID=A0ABT0QIK7_9FLAO|nr:tetratricopeptide repeat protein [Jejuia spongiicola]MCL6296720.1 tetratricopeptide repeat protein [Jejuia spongiicola]
MQEKEKDSLKELMARTDNDSIWAANADILAGLTAISNPIQAEKIFFEALEKLQKDSYHYSNKHRRIASIYDGLGVLERRRNQFSKALEYYFKAIEIKKREKDSLSIGSSYHYIAMLHIRMDNIDSALKYMGKALSLRKHGDSISYGISLNNYGYFYLRKRVYDSAQFYFTKAKLFFGNDIRVNDTYLYMARLYIYKKQYKKALNIHLQILETYKKHKKLERVATILKNIAYDYRKLNNFIEAEKYLKESEFMAKSFGNKQLLAIIYNERYYLSKKNNDFETALKHRLTYQKYKDSLSLAEQSKNIGEIETTYRFKKEALLDSLSYVVKKEQLIALEKTQRNRKTFFIFLFTVSLFGIISLFFIYRYRHENNIQKIENQKLETDFLNGKVDFFRFKIEQLLLDNKMRVKFKDDLRKKIKLINQTTDRDKMVSEYQTLIIEIQNQANTENRLDTITEKLIDLDVSFEKKLAEEFPMLSKSEREVCKLMRLNLSMKEVMNILDITMASIKSIRYRIRKKLGIPKNVNCEIFIKNLFGDRSNKG